MFKLGTLLRAVRYSSKSFLKVHNPLRRNFCNFPCKLPMNRKTMIWQDATTISIYDPSLLVKDAINKGFAYLVSDKEAYSYSSRECFEIAQKNDPKNEYRDIINCGIN